MKRAYAFAAFALLPLLCSPSYSTSAQNTPLDGRYSGKLAAISAENCGEQSEKFWAEVKGASIRVYSPRAKRAFDGVIASNGRFLVGGLIATDSNRLALEWGGQITAAGRALGTLTVRGENLCQFVFSLQKE